MEYLKMKKQETMAIFRKTFTALSRKKIDNLSFNIESEFIKHQGISKLYFRIVIFSDKEVNGCSNDHFSYYDFYSKEEVETHINGLLSLIDKGDFKEIIDYKDI